MFGYSLTLLPLLRANIAFRAALGLSFASDTISIAVMEIIDNALMMLIPGAMEVGVTSLPFWGSMTLSLVLAGAAAFPINRRLIARGRGHAVIHQQHGGHAPSPSAPQAHHMPSHAAHHAHH